MGYGLVNAYDAVKATLIKNLSISGPDALCSGTIATYSISNLPQGTTVSWYANGLNLSAAIGASTNATTIQGAGAGYVRATITSSNGTLILTKELALNGYTPIIGPDFEYLSNKKAYFEIDTQEPSVWSVNGDTFTSMPYSNRIVVPLYQYYPGSVLITCAVNSSCGHYEARKDFQIIGDEEALDAYSLYPNPTSTSFSIKQNEELQAMSSTLVGDAKSQDNLSILIYNDQSQLLRQQKVYLNQAVSIDNLREGLYIIHIKDGKKVHKKKLIIRRN
ncbi:T9SS type A sorting domain-containing protein [Acetobacteroides hydrogenigenes]|uniref:Putative secreted protein (Por secretion system target) n=1 Tax=Acetobacteroides hydrogenigenes TaxID=979970 RepID=A0A4R2F550_9BACT|nr:T9SS type A sorting domain-containing protein [Acetobacteroides hydrogenigenes]TCN72289.1 putative secreted protein (Por secretion system target) [Acetobacteroides hydrogenigenes]